MKLIIRLSPVSGRLQSFVRYARRPTNVLFFLLHREFSLILSAISVLTVAGAGRGPLVARSLNAIERSSRDVAVYAIEKNPSAYVTYGTSVFMSSHDQLM